MSFPRYPEYKNSGVEWLGEVPAHWAVVPIKAVATCNDEVLEEKTSDDFEIDYVEISDIDAVAGITGSTTVQFGRAPSRARRIVQDGDVLVSTVRTYLRAIAQVKGDPGNMIASTGFAVIRPRKVHPGYLGYACRAEYLISEVIARSVGVSYPAINATDLMHLQIPIPTVDEQRAVEEFLDAELMKIDGLVAEQEKLIALLKEKRQAVISSTVTKGLDPNVTMRDSGVEWLGAVPAHWEVKPLKTLASGVEGLFIDGDWIESRNISDEGIRYITTGNVGAGFYKEQGSGFISKETFNELNCTEVIPGDILISRLNPPIGRACLVPDLRAQIVTSVDNVIVRTSSNVNREFLVFRLTSTDYLSETKNLASGATMQRISRSELGRVRLSLPPLKEQVAIADFLNFETKRIDELICDAEAGIELLKERRSALISAAVTGKIDVRQLANTEAA